MNLQTSEVGENVNKKGHFFPFHMGVPIKSQRFEHYQVLLGNCALLVVKQHEKLHANMQGERPFRNHSNSKSDFVIILF